MWCESGGDGSGKAGLLILGGDVSGASGRWQGWKEGSRLFEPKPGPTREQVEGVTVSVMPCTDGRDEEKQQAASTYSTADAQSSTGPERCVPDRPPTQHNSPFCQTLAHCASQAARQRPTLRVPSSAHHQGTPRVMNAHPKKGPAFQGVGLKGLALRVHVEDLGSGAPPGSLVVSRASTSGTSSAAVATRNTPFM